MSRKKERGISFESAPVSVGWCLILLLVLIVFAILDLVA